MLADCQRCGEALASALVCEACDALQEVAGRVDPWAVFGLEVGYAVEVEALRKRLLTLQRRMHPDFFGAADPALRARAEENTAELNAAHRLLADDVRRADHLIARAGGPDEEAERQMPAAFLMEVLEWNETLETAQQAPPDSPGRAALDPLERDLTAKRRETLERVGDLLTPLPPTGDATLTRARQELNAIRYLDRALSNLAELRLEQAKSTG